jgi:hypothetical protein
MKKYIIIISVACLLITNACKKFVEGEDLSPNQPLTATNASLLVTSEIAVMSSYTGQLSRTSSILIQHSSGTLDIMLGPERYNLNEQDNLNDWYTLYSSCMVNIDALRKQAGDANPHFRGIANILMAMTIGVTTDLWGDVPYSKALKGASNNTADFNPLFDKQKDVYDAIQLMLDNAILDLAKSESSNVTLPGTSDILFGGDVKKWTAIAHLLKARYTLHLSRRNASAYATALTHLQNAYTAGLTSSANDLNALFGKNAQEYNQWYNFVQVSRNGYIKMGANLVDIMRNYNDPRLDFYCGRDVNDSITGSTPGSENTDASDAGAYFASDNSPLPMVTFVEAKFIEAECKLKTGDKAGAATAYNDAVKAHIALVTAAPAPTDYVNNYASATSSSINDTMVMTQKYISSFTQIETYNDWRRTGLPVLTPIDVSMRNPAATGIPRRLPTPLDERIYNSNATVVQDIMKPVWWDE